MTIPTANIRFTLTFVENLDNTIVRPATNRVIQPLHHFGVLKGRRQLRAFLEKMNVEACVRFFGGSTIHCLTAESIEAGPEQIVENLERSFEKADKLPFDILDHGDTMSIVERSFVGPLSLTVASSSVTLTEGFERDRDWFASQVS